MDEDGVEPKTKAKPKAEDVEDDPNDLSKYNLDNYDEENIGAGAYTECGLVTPTYSFAASGPFSNIKGLTYYRSNDDDPYITLKEVRLQTHPPRSLTNAGAGRR
jgi:periodic tryptophan protein 1